MTTNQTTNLTTTQIEIAEAVTRTLTVFTTPQACKPGFELVAASTKSSEGKQVATENRMRCIVIPELVVDNVPSKFQSLVMDALRRTAKAQLAAMWKNEPSLQSVPAAVWSVDNLLLFAAKQAEGTRLTKENCLEWFLQSKLCAHLMNGEGATPKKYEDWKARIVGLAAPVLQLNEGQCTVTIAAIGKFDEDAASPMAAQMITKLQRRIDDMQRQNEEIEAV